MIRFDDVRRRHRAAYRARVSALWIVVVLWGAYGIDRAIVGAVAPPPQAYAMLTVLSAIPATVWLAAWTRWRLARRAYAAEWHRADP